MCHSATREWEQVSASAAGQGASPEEPAVGAAAAWEKWPGREGSRGHLAAPELAGARSGVIFASAHPPRFPPLPCLRCWPLLLSRGDNSWNYSEVPGGSAAVSDSASGGDSGWAWGMRLVVGETRCHASVKLVAGAGIQWVGSLLPPLPHTSPPVVPAVPGGPEQHAFVAWKWEMPGSGWGRQGPWLAYAHPRTTLPQGRWGHFSLLGFFKLLGNI